MESRLVVRFFRAQVDDPIRRVGQVVEVGLKIVAKGLDERLHILEIRIQGRIQLAAIHGQGAVLPHGNAEGGDAFNAVIIGEPKVEVAEDTALNQAQR